MSDHPTEDHLRRALEHRAAHASYDATPSSRVAHAAHRVRRRRRAAAGALATAAVAAVVVVPVAILGGPETTGPSPAPAPASPSPSATQFAQEEQSPDDPPRIGYAAGGTYYAPDGTTIAIPDGDPVVGAEALDTDPTSLAVTRDPGDGDPLAWSLVSEGVEGEVSCASHVPTFTTDALGDVRVLSLARSCASPSGDDESGGDELSLRELAGGETLTRSVPRGSRFVDDEGGVVALNTPTDGVYVVGVGGYLPRARPVPGLASASALNTGRFEAGAAAGLLENGDGAVVTFDGAVQWQRAGLEPLTFSRDQQVLLAREANDLVVVGAADGRERTRYAGAADLSQATWEEGRDLVGVRTDQDGAQSLVRLGPDATVTPLSDTPTLGPDDLFVFDEADAR